MIQIARVYEPAKENDGRRVLVDRLWPRGVKKENAHVDQWMKEIAPSEALRKWFRHTPERWPEFQRRYKAELAKKKELISELKQAEKTHGTLTLVFGAKDKERNQAIVLLNLLKNKK
jgi:uncharacterized protein YeaO (DUF488 family)